jgi:ribokinase
MSELTRPSDVVVVGSINVDLVATVPHLPVPGETVIGSGFERLPGGKGANQAVAASRAGAATTLIARVGGDDFGTQQREQLRGVGIDVSQVGTCKHDPTGVALITVDARTGENAITVVSGANAKIRPEHIADAVSAGVLAPARVVLAQLEVPLPVVEAALRAARAAGVRTILNPAPAPAGGLSHEFLALCDIVVCNEGERDALGAALEQVPEVIVTLGADGVRWSGGWFAPHRVDVVDTTGAGDAFCGAFAAALATGADLGEAVRRGNAAGALACTALGAQSSSPSADAIDELLDAPVIDPGSVTPVR